MRPKNLQQIIREKIRTDGPMTFEAFMEAALYYPELGYYTAPKTRIGPEGDFYTSPHLHSIFGWLLAIQLSELKSIIEDPDEFTILEIGAGKGYLAESIIDFIRRKLNWKGNWRYIIVEKNPHVVKDQKKHLAPHQDLIVWKTSLDEVEMFNGCVIANEVLDAFPVHLVVGSDPFQEIYVGLKEDRFTELQGRLSEPVLSSYVEKYNIPKINGYRTEINLRILDYLKKLNRILVEGFVISIDYGYSARDFYSVERSQGTLLCYYRHAINEDPYLNIGEQDMTAHVNFTSLKDWGNDLGLRSIGFCPQGTFLASLGIDDIISKELETDPNFHHELLKIKGLLFDMGESHHVMVQYKGNRGFDTLKGLKLNNRIDRL